MLFDFLWKLRTLSPSYFAEAVETEGLKSHELATEKSYLFCFILCFVFFCVCSMTYVGAYELNNDHGNKVRVIYMYRRLIMCTGTDLSIEISFNHLEVRRYIHIQTGTFYQFFV